MLKQIYECAGITIIYILSMMLSRYIFLIPVLPRRWKQVVFLICGWMACTGLCWLWGTRPAFVLLGILLGAYIFLTGNGGKRRFFRILQLFPVMGLSFGLVYPPLEIPGILFEMQENVLYIYSLVIYALALIAVSIFAIRGSRWRKEFREEMHYRHLLHWEQSLLYTIGSIMFVFTPVFSQYEVMEEISWAVIRSTCITSLIMFIVTLTVIILILQGNKSAQFREQVLRMQHNIIITLADIVENRDENTGGHIKRTAKYVEIIAIKLKAADLYGNILNEKYIADMIIAAPLHDIGKIHIPDAVLKKEGRFNDDEYDIMKSHTTAGRKLLLQAEKTLGKSGYLDIAVQMAGCHHEWWNGKGYPEGLKGQDIPLCARIMAVADVFDAIVSQRCYKGAMSIDEAYELIRRDSGTHFDPVVVDAFLEARDDITEVLREFREQPMTAEKFAVSAPEIDEADEDSGEKPMQEAEKETEETKEIIETNEQITVETVSAS